MKKKIPLITLLNLFGATIISQFLWFVNMFVEFYKTIFRQAENIFIYTMAPFYLLLRLSTFLKSTVCVATNTKYGIPLSGYTVFWNRPVEESSKATFHMLSSVFSTCSIFILLFVVGWRIFASNKSVLLVISSLPSGRNRCIGHIRRKGAWCHARCVRCSADFRIRGRSSRCRGCVGHRRPLSWGA